MKMKRLVSLTLVLFGILALGAPISVTALDAPGAQEEPAQAVQEMTEMAETEEAEAPQDDGMQIIVNGSPLPASVPLEVEDGTTYVYYFSVVKALYPDAQILWGSSSVTVTAPGLELKLPTAKKYMIANGRYLYLPTGYRFSGNALLVPVRTLCAALGADVAWDPIGNDVVITAGKGPIASADQYYDADALYWLSRIINAESGNQSLEGKIAVGNVVLNRVASDLFPNSIYSVIFQKSQFTPVKNGTIYDTPNKESIVAAKLCLDGANTADNALFFFNPKLSPNCWATKNRNYLTTIGSHAFYD